MRFSTKPIGKVILFAWLILSVSLISPPVEDRAQRNKRRQAQLEQVKNPPLVRAFRGRHSSDSESIRVENAQINNQQLGQILGNLSTRYATLTVWSTHVANRGYLIFRTLGGLGADGEINGLTGNAHFGRGATEIEIGLKPQAPGKSYLFDCSVRADPSCSSCGFSVHGPDGHTEKWDGTQGSEFQHLYFTITTSDADWYIARLQGVSYDFKSCYITPMP